MDTRTTPPSVAALLHGRRNEEIAEAVGVSLRTAKRWRNGTALPQVRHVSALSFLTGRSVEEIGALILQERRPE